MQRYPTPEAATRLDDERMKAFLASHAFCGRRSPAELLARLGAAPTESEAKGEIVRALAAVLARLVGEIAKLTGRVEQAVADLPDGQIVTSSPARRAPLCSRDLAERGDVRERFPTADQLAVEPAPARTSTPRAREGSHRIAG